MTERAQPYEVIEKYPFLGPDTELTRAIAAFDWSATALGPINHWPGELRTAVGLMMNSGSASAVWWGDELWLIHNEAYARELLRERGPSLGRKFDDIWGEVSPVVRPQFDAILQTGLGATWNEQRVDMERDGRLEETYWNYSFSPVIGTDGRVQGIFNGAREVTGVVLQTRINGLLVELDDALAGTDSIDTALVLALRLIAEQLNAHRAGFGDVDLASNSIDIRQLWASADMPDIRGRYPLGNFGAISEELAMGHSVIIDDARTDPRTADPVVRRRYDHIKLRSGLVIPIIEDGCYVGGVFVQDAVPRIWSRAEILLAEAATRRLWAALKRLRADAALRDSEQRYRLIFEQAEDIIFTADIDQRITDANDAGAKAIGLSRDALIGRSIADFVDAEGFAQTTSMLQHKLNEGGNTRHEVPVMSADGRAMRWENNSTLIVDPDKRPIGLLSISRDVTERRAFEERRELLIHELNHRVKNTLALVQAIAHQSFRPGADSVTAQDNFMARIRTLAGAHDLLTREHWEGVTLAELVRAATAPLDATRIDARGAMLVVTPKAAVALAMALHELGTNAVKYGALSTPEGRVSIDWNLDAERLHLDWRESGGPSVSAPERRGFGVKMIERALASDLGGRVSVQFASEGVYCTIDAPCGGNVT